MTRVRYSSYDIVARARKQTPIYYEEFGSYRGEWILVSCDDENYYIYKDYYGSCSGCDSLEDEAGYSDDAEFGSSEFTMGSEQVEKFIANYPPFAVIPKATMITMVKEGRAQQAFPANIRDGYSEITLDDAIKQTSLMVKSLEGFITGPELLEINNMERRREAIERFGGEDVFMDAIGGDVIDTEGENRLVRLERDPEPFVYVNVQDSSTSRRYMLRVPPTTKTVKEGIAWTFDLKPEEYNPSAET